MPKEKKQKDVQLPVLPSLYSILPSTTSTSTFTSSNYSHSTAGGKDQSKESSKELKELEFWLERSDASTSRGVGSCRGVLEKILEVEREKEVTEKKLDWKRVTRRERYRVEERFKDEDGSRNKRKDKRGGERDKKGKEKEIELEEGEVDMMEIDDQGINSTGAESDTSIDHESGAESSLSDDDRPRKRRKKQVYRSGKRPDFVKRELPEFEVPEVEIPDDLPTGDLLHSIHTYASQKFTSNYSLLPPLSLSTPYPTESQSSYFTTLLEKSHQAEQASSLLLSLTEWNELKSKSWETSNNKGLQKGVWTNVERGFDDSVLMVLGCLVMELVERDVEARKKRERRKMEKVRRESSRSLSRSGSFGNWDEKEVVESDEEGEETEEEDEDEEGEEESGNSTSTNQRRRRRNRFSRSKSPSAPNLSQRQHITNQEEEEEKLKKQSQITEREEKLLAFRMEKAIKYREGLEAAKIRKEEREERTRRAGSRREGTYDTVNGTGGEGEGEGKKDEIFRRKSTKSLVKKEFKSLEFIEDSDEEL